MAQEICRVEEPPLLHVSDGHEVACHFAEEAARSNPFGSSISAFAASDAGQRALAVAKRPAGPGGRASRPGAGSQTRRFFAHCGRSASQEVGGV